MDRRPLAVFSYRARRRSTMRIRCSLELIHSLVVCMIMSEFMQSQAILNLVTRQRFLLATDKHHLLVTSKTHPLDQTARRPTMTIVRYCAQKQEAVGRSAIPGAVQCNVGLAWMKESVPIRECW